MYTIATIIPIDMAEEPIPTPQPVLPLEPFSIVSNRELIHDSVSLMFCLVDSASEKHYFYLFCSVCLLLVYA